MTELEFTKPISIGGAMELSVKGYGGEASCHRNDNGELVFVQHGLTTDLAFIAKEVLFTRFIELGW